MEVDLAVLQLGALAQQTRLVIYKNLVVAGSQGIAAGELAMRALIAPSALSFHAKELRHAGLIRSETRGRNVIYLAELDAMTALIAYLLENCCVGFDLQASTAALACANLSATCCVASEPKTEPAIPKTKLRAIP
jgi:ArsR family transcriptional regulator